MLDIIINIVLLFVSIIVGSLVFFVPLFKSKQKFSVFVKENTDILTASIILIIATISRVCLLDKIPLGINQDETSLGYDAYSLLNWGIDRNGMKFPVQLIAWGSGQNVLYAYFVIPFIALLGNTEIALRLPMALVSSFSLYITYFVLRKVKDRKVALVSLFIFAIMPWHIMKSRWALESNLFPELVLQGMMLLVLSLNTNKHILFYLSAIILGLSSYSYGTSYFFLFFFVIGFLIYLLVKKYEKWYHVFFYLLTVGIICIPIMLFLYINIFDKETIHLFFFDIPKLKSDRFHSVTSLFSSEFLKDCKNNLTDGLRIILTQYDCLPWNATEIFGTMYLFTLPFSIIGLFHRSKKEILTDSLTTDKGFKTYINLIRISLVVSLFMLCIIHSNINRMNVIFIPLILSAGIGIHDVMSLSKRIAIPLSTLYVASYISFSLYYPLSWVKERITPYFYNGFKDALKYSIELSPKEYYITTKTNYTLVLYYTGLDVHDYIDTVKYYNPGSAFENPKNFANYNFYLPTYLEDDCIYILRNGEDKYDDMLGEYQKVYFDDYYVISTIA